MKGALLLGGRRVTPPTLLLGHTRSPQKTPRDVGFPNLGKGNCEFFQALEKHHVLYPILGKAAVRGMVSTAFPADHRPRVVTAQRQEMKRSTSSHRQPDHGLRHGPDVCTVPRRRDTPPSSGELRRSMAQPTSVFRLLGKPRTPRRVRQARRRAVARAPAVPRVRRRLS